jgi:hypothetical protein
MALEQMNKRLSKLPHQTVRQFRRIICQATFQQAGRTLLAGALISVVAYTFWTSRLLRPVADDYVYGVVASEGLVQSVTYFWYNWSGAVVDSFVGTLLVGLPLAFLPWPLTSSVSFLSTAVVMAFLGIRLQSSWRGAASSGASRRSLLIRFTTLLATWWGYWWLPIPSVPVASESYAIALAATHWQTVVSKYSMTFALLFLMWITIQSSNRMRHRYFTLKSIIFGLVIGFNHSVLAVSSVVFVFLYSICLLLHARRLSNRKLLSSLLIGFWGTAGTILSHLSPGSQYRTTLLANPALDGALVRQLMFDVVPASAREWSLAIISWNSLVVFMVIGGVTCLFAPRVDTREIKHLALMGCSVLGFALTYCFVSRAGQLFAYEAFWHEVGPRSAVWLGLVTLATASGLLAAHHSETLTTKFLVPLALVIGLYFLIGSLDLMNRQIIDRFEPWQLGPAAVYDISDIENEDWWGWWLKLRSLRDAPDRTLP